MVFVEKRVTLILRKGIDMNKPSSPTTEAGRRLLADFDTGSRFHVFGDAYARIKEGILAIEQQAREGERTEAVKAIAHAYRQGRREGCSKHHSAEDCRAYFDQTLEQARDEGRREAVRLANDWLNGHPGARMTVEDHADWYVFLRSHGYDPVAGLNASESPARDGSYMPFPKGPYDD